jgi:tetratricopeptide (TPR) repeat protein
MEMKRGIWVALVLPVCVAGCLAAGTRLLAQAPAAADAPKTPASAPQTGSNPFPEDTSTVPVLPSKVEPVLPAGTDSWTDNGAVSGRVPLRGDETDPVRSPDDPATEEGSGQDADSSSSLSGLDRVIPRPEDDQPDKRRKKAKEKEPTHQETISKDLEVGGYYLEKKNWRAAESRFQSAMVLDPENPEVYWGMAEAERNLGDFAAARDHYLKLLDFDPDGPHGKQARKALKDPAVANAKSASAGQAPVGPPK